jgi:hypothetical protein
VSGGSIFCALIRAVCTDLRGPADVSRMSPWWIGNLSSHLALWKRCAWLHVGLNFKKVTYITKLPAKHVEEQYVARIILL